MTEMTAYTDKFEAYPIHWIGFVAALIAAPIIITTLTSLFVIPVFALYFGWPTYLLFGAPFFWFGLKYLDAGPFLCALLGFAANAASFYPIEVYFADGGKLAEFIVGFGHIFAPVWGFAFGLIYRGFRSMEAAA